MTKYSKGEWTNARYDICEIECDGEVYCTVATKDVDLIIDVLNENEQLKKQIERIDFILDDLNGAEYISRDDGIKALNKIDKVIGKR